MSTASHSRTARAQLVTIVVIALLSLGGAYLLFYLAREDGLWGTTNKGAFVDPPVNVSELAVRTDAGADFETGGRWWLWVVPQGPCASACQHALHQLRQLHVLLHRDASRVRRGLVTASGEADAAAVEPYPQLEVLSGNLGVLDRGIYVVDPLGNLVFHYPMEDAGEPVLDDLKRLLKVSQIG